MEYRTHYITPQDYKIAEQNGISRKTLESRVRRQGYHVEYAIREPIPKRRNLKRWLPTLEANNIPYNRFKRRVNDGWDEEKAATTPYVKPRGRKTKGNLSLARGLLMVTDMSYSEIQKATGCSRTMIANHAREIRSWTSHYEKEESHEII